MRLRTHGVQRSNCWNDWWVRSSLECSGNQIRSKKPKESKQVHSSVYCGSTSSSSNDILRSYSPTRSSTRSVKLTSRRIARPALRYGSLWLSDTNYQVHVIINRASHLLLSLSPLSSAFCFSKAAMRRFSAVWLSGVSKLSGDGDWDMGVLEIAF